MDDADRLLRIGVDKIVINSEGVKNPIFLENLVKIYGASTVAVNIDTIKNSKNYEVLIETGREKTGLELNRWIDKLQKIGVGEIIVTDIFSEGKMKGFNINFYKNLRKRIDLPLIAHGGAGSKENILDIFQEANLDGVSIASLFHYKYLVEEKENKTIGTNFYLKILISKKNQELLSLSLKNTYHLRESE